MHSSCLFNKAKIIFLDNVQQWNLMHVIEQEEHYRSIIHEKVKYLNKLFEGLGFHMHLNVLWEIRQTVSQNNEMENVNISKFVQQYMQKLSRNIFLHIINVVIVNPQ